MPKITNRNFPEPKPIRNARFLNVGNGLFAIVDKEDYDLVKPYVWCLNKKYGIVTNLQNPHTCTRLQRMIMGETKHFITHKNRNELDNRKKNLVVLENKGMVGFFGKKQVRKHAGKNPSKYKGVTIITNSKIHPYVAMIRFNGKLKRIGIYSNEEDAARAYDKKALELFGELAATNKKLGLLD